MRILPTLLLALAIALSMTALAPGATARELACSDTITESCEGLVCLDQNLDGLYQPNECEPRYCTCDPQPEPW